MSTSIHDLSAAYALDALDPDEREAFERHLDECPDCREQLASFLDVGAALAVAADGPPPPPALRDRILADAHAEKSVVVPLAARRRTRVLAASTAIAAAVAIGLGIYAAILHGQLGDARSARDAQAGVAAILGDPSATTVGLKSGSGRLVVAADGRAVLVLHDLAPLRPGTAYETWVITGTTPVPAGTFDPSGTRAVVTLDRPVPQGAVVAVTVERSGGATTPTLPAVAASEPV